MQNRHTTQRSLWLLGLLLFGFFSAVAQASVVSSGWLQNLDHPPVKTQFVLTGQVDPQHQTVTGYLEVMLSGDWKTYWRSPGEGGVAPTIAWDNSSNIQNIDWHWPYPTRFDVLGVETLGYKQRVIFPMTLYIEELSQPVILNANLTLSSCTTICVLTDYPFELSFIPNELQVNQDAMHVYAQGISQVPQSSPLIGGVEARWDVGQSKLQVVMDKQLGWQQPTILLDGESETVVDSVFVQQNLVIDNDRLVATYDVTSWLGSPQLSGEALNITVQDENFIAEQSATITSGSVSTHSASYSIAEMFLLALIGGLLLNVMPCVLPVLGMKLSSVVGAHGLEKKQIRLQFLASASGILFSFWLLAIFLLILKLSGSAIGWGIQFQSGWFIGLMVLVTALFGANMLGLFEIRLSSKTTTWLGSQGDNSYRGHFTQGMFATLLATPCSAPFLGTAVAFALATNSMTMFAIFTALALGMALPWILVALFPAMALALPKPGKWMSSIKLAFGAMMLLTSLWLLTLLSNHLPIFWVYVIGILAFAWVVVRVLRVYGEKPAALFGGSVIILASLGMIVGSMTADRWATPLPDDPDWERLSVQSIEQHVYEGKTVFVNVTADWCITCKANKIGVILQDPVYSTLAQSDVVPMLGDWTTPSESVTSYLRDNGRFGVPFNMVYGPAAPNGIPLPVILTEESVMQAIGLASGRVQL
ncbi:protein-disulfide reductase DsbD family protein [Vibrio maerlii]|uniref:protein-disulfide reductase DsbD family protein n=1 Tax=Vibrio maerlii TaxID=2231648 RepID=UPI000E3C161F|nr:protein-disulfide reductase DsbD domain-containing protein [Vibrio maerlii]